MGGCGQSSVVNQRTAEAPPIGIDPPVGRALSSNSTSDMQGLFGASLS